MANKTKYKGEWADKLIEHMRKGMSYESFGAVCHASIVTMDTWARKHPDFAQAKEMGKVYERQYWEDMLQKGARGQLPSIRKTIVRLDAEDNKKGAIVIDEPAKVNATLIIFALKNKFPKEWRDKKEIDVTNHGDDLSKMTPDEIKKRADIYRAALNGPGEDQEGS